MSYNFTNSIHFNMMTKVFFFSLLLSLSALKLNAQKFSEDFWGVPMTCLTDSTSLTTDTIIKLKRAVPSNKGPYPKNPTFKYLECGNTPEYIEVVQFWPTQLTLHFKKGDYFFLHSPRPTDPNLKYGDNGFSIAYNYDLGTLSVNKKSKTLTLTSSKYNWSKTYNYRYSKKEDVLYLH